MRRYKFVITILAVGAVFTAFSVMLDSQIYASQDVEKKESKFYDDKDSLKFSIFNLELKMSELTRLLAGGQQFNVADMSSKYMH